MFAIVKPFLLAVGIIFVLLFALGVIQIKKTKYGCFHGKKLEWGDKVEIINLGSLHIYSFPLSYDCPEDERFDPDNVYKCGVQAYCQGSENASQE